MVTFVVVNIVALCVGLFLGDRVGSRSTARIEERRQRMQSEWQANDPRWGIYEGLMAGEIGPPIR